MAFTPGQEQCINTLDRSLVVAAGAGSGKTFTLTKRIVHAISSGAVQDIGRVCAITFTNKAAGELKSRLKAELRACGLADQALAVDEAWVSTIHGMCARILRAHAVELDIDPQFKMADGPLVGTLRDQAVDEALTLARLASHAVAVSADDLPLSAVPDARLQEVEGLPSAQDIDALFAEYPARSYGAGSSSVELMVGQLVELAGSRPDGFDSFVVDDFACNPAALVSAVADAFEAVAQAASAEKPNEAREAWAAQALDRIAGMRDGLQSHASDATWAVQQLDALDWPKKVGSAGYKQQAEQAIGTYRMCVMELRLALARKHLHTVAAIAKEASVRFAAAKREQGVLDNNDLLVMAFDAITNNPRIAALYADKFQLVMVDEFQDTDQMQVDMIKALSGPDACRLCTVGDAQQSIYRFRGADVSVYNRHLGMVQQRSAQDVIRLADNFRSHADVLSFVDRVFEQPNVFGGEFMSLAPGRGEARIRHPFAKDAPRIQVQLTSTCYRGASSATVRQVAAQRIAEAFADLRDKGHRAGQMALLLGGMTYAGMYAQALRDQGFACVISGGSVFAQSAEAQAVRDFVCAIANPFQTQALHNVLTSPLFQLTAQDLLVLTTVPDKDDGLPRFNNLASGLVGLAYRQRQGQHDPNWSPQLATALRVMGSVIDSTGRSSVARMLSRALFQSGLLMRLQDQGAEGLASAANYYKAIRMVESIESPGGIGPSGVARAFEALLRDSKEAPGALSATGGDFVRIMTVHASKGLEFPIVAVAELKDSAGSSAKLLTSEVSGKVYLSLDAGNSVANLSGRAALKELPALYASLMEGRATEDEFAQEIQVASGALQRRAALFEYERAGDEEESKRLLYVALTRAKEALVVSLRGKSAKDNPQASPKGCLGAVVTALAGPGRGFDEGRSLMPYGGSMPALVSHVALSSDDGALVGGVDEHADAEGPGQRRADVHVVPGGLRDDSGEAEGKGCQEGQNYLFKVPVAPEEPRVSRVPYAPAHEGVFSYSSIADAARESAVVGTLAQRFFAGADACHDEGAFTIYLRPADEGASDFAFEQAGHQNHHAAVADEDDGSWAYAGTSCADSDKATDLGSAFHRLAQYAVAVRGSEGALEKPPAERIDALARAAHLDEAQRSRLDEALDRWFASDVAQSIAALADLKAEAPFFLKLDEALAPSGAFLEGEIDLLATDGAGSALVVDYKTGGRADETSDDLALKHVLQASCYAYAVLMQGFSQVHAVFVRVERSRADDPCQPQCVRYRFSVDDLPVLAEAIAQAYGQALLGGESSR